MCEKPFLKSLYRGLGIFRERKIQTSNLKTLILAGIVNCSILMMNSQSYGFNGIDIFDIKKSVPKLQETTEYSFFKPKYTHGLWNQRTINSELITHVFSKNTIFSLSKQPFLNLHSITGRLRLAKFENSMLSPNLRIPLLIGWAANTYELLLNRNEFYGSSVDGEKIHIFADHLHIGFGLHLVGSYLKNSRPDIYYRLSYSSRFILSLGTVIQFDDMFQHMVMQKFDNYNLDKNMHGTIAESPVHYLYGLMENKKLNGNWKIMLDLLYIRKFTISVGFYQGAAGEISYDLKTIFRNRIDIKLNSIVGVAWHPQTQVMLEQVVTGLSFDYRVTKWLSLEAGSGLRLLSNNPYLDQKIVIFYGLKIK